MYVYVRVYIVPISERAPANRESTSGLRAQSYAQKNAPTRFVSAPEGFSELPETFPETSGTFSGTFSYSFSIISSNLLANLQILSDKPSFTHSSI